MAIVTNIFLVIGTFVATFGFFIWWKNRGNIKRKGGLLPSPPAFPSLPIVGSLPFLRGFNNAADFFLKSSDKYGQIFTVMAGPRKLLILNGKEMIEEACVNHKSSFSGRTGTYIDTLENPRRKGLNFRQNDSEFKRHHQLCLSCLRDFGFGVKNIMDDRTHTEVEAMADYVRKINGQKFAPRNIIAMVVTNVSNNIMFGMRRKYQDGLGELYIQAERLTRSVDITMELSPAIRFLPQYREKIRRYKDSQGKMTILLKQEIERCKEVGAEDCFVKRYLEKEGNNLDYEQLLWTVRDLIAAGTNTTISTILWAMAALADHPVVQDRLRSEIDAVVQRSRFPTMDDQSNLPYAEATILESMRWKTLIPLGVPRMTLKDVNINGYFVPAKTQVLTNIYAAHMDPKVWKEPNEFRPERFLDEDSNVIGKDRVIPFGLGRRSCLGEVLARTEIFLVLTAIVQNFIILPPEGQDKIEARPFEPIGLAMVPLPFNIRLIPRT